MVLTVLMWTFVKLFNLNRLLNSSAPSCPDKISVLNKQYTTLQSNARYVLLQYLFV